MLVIIKSAPDTTDAIRAVKLAKEMSANIALLQNGVYLAGSPLLDGLPTLALEEDMRMRGITGIDVKQISYEELVDTMADEDKVIGMF